MNILLTNDDGYNAIGINILKEKLKKYGTVYEVSPTYHQSGASMSFSINKGFKVKKYDEYTYSIDGTPADNMLIGLQILGQVKFDLVVSGVNDGLNISYDSLYSGTVAACLEAINMGIPSIALSTDFGCFDIVRNELESVLDYVIYNKLYDKSYCLNINFPTKDYSSSKGIKITKEVHKKDKYYTSIKNGFLYYDRYESFDTEEKDSDIYAINHGYISITTLHNTFFDKEGLDLLKSKIK